MSCSSPSAAGSSIKPQGQASQPVDVLFYNPKTGGIVGREPELRWQLMIPCIDLLRNRLIANKHLSSPINDEFAQSLFKDSNIQQLTPEEAEACLCSDSFRYNTHNLIFLKSYLKLVHVCAKHRFADNRCLNIHHLAEIGSAMLETPFLLELERNLKAVFEDADAIRDAAILYPMHPPKYKVPFLFHETCRVKTETKYYKMPNENHLRSYEEMRFVQGYVEVPVFEESGGKIQQNRINGEWYSDPTDGRIAKLFNQLYEQHRQAASPSIPSQAACSSSSSR